MVWVVMCFLCLFLGFLIGYIKYAKEPTTEMPKIIKPRKKTATEMAVEREERIRKQMLNMANYTGGEGGQVDID